MAKTAHKLDITKEDKLSIWLRIEEQKQTKGNSSAYIDPVSSARQSSEQQTRMSSSPSSYHADSDSPVNEYASAGKGGPDLGGLPLPLLTKIAASQQAQSQRKDNYLLEYQNQLLVLEDLNRRTSQKFKKPR